MTVGATAGPGVADGRTIKLAPTSLTVTPLNGGAVANLTLACPCGGTWTIGVPRTFKSACPAGTCPDYTWLRQPIGVPVYGSARRVYKFIRFTVFSDSPAVGYNTSLAVFDYPYVEKSSGSSSPECVLLSPLSSLSL
jgi:hypothetical protein